MEFNTSLQCDPVIRNWTPLLLPILTLSLLIISVFSWLEWRNGKHDGDIGLTRIIIALNFIDDVHNRWRNAIAFGAVADVITELLFFSTSVRIANIPNWGMGIFINSDHYVDYFNIHVSDLPMHQHTVQVSGFDYWNILLWNLVNYLLSLITNKELPIDDIHTDSRFTNNPLVSNYMLASHVTSEFQMRYVGSLLNSAKRDDDIDSEHLVEPVAAPCISINNSCLHVNIGRKIDRLLIDAKIRQLKMTYFHKNFRYSTKMLVTLFLSLVMLYKVMFLDIYVIDLFSKQCLILLQNQPTWIPIMKEFAGILFICIGIGFLLTLVSLAHLMFIYRRHFGQISRGDRSFLPQQRLIPNPAAIVAASMRFPGYQVASIIWGYLIFQVSMTVLASLLYFGVIRPIILGDAEYFKQVMTKSLMWYNNASFYFTFFNVNIGLVSSVKRLLYGTVIGIVFSSRLHRSVLMRGMEKFDRGYFSYVCMLLLDHAHTNPIMRSFCHLLQQPPVLHPASQGKKLWLLCRTLVANPELVKYRQRKAANNNDELQSLAVVGFLPNQYV
ncbi:stimulated by retinoic acid gene 6 protein-like [Tubulanus polymorphus]|uniref:stimulated by retinoic acid gene 6 protein-like n=1 Tax=Tubulanus polymorphus TaxID=672921 RepID=UPI003DA1EC88